MSDQADAAPAPQFNIRRIYLKDMSFESPKAPQIFDVTTQPQIDMQLGAGATQLGENLHEVVVNVTATVRSGEDTVFLVEVQQAGLFHIEGVPAEQMGWVLGVTCPNVLFPYVRQVVSDATVAGGFPPLLLAPVNFEALYQQHLQRQQATAGGQVTH
jgi:preprotein translocase subunit SecB